MSWPNPRGDDTLQADYRDATLIEGPHDHFPIHPSTIYLPSFYTHPKQADLSLDFSSATAYLPSNPSPNGWPHNAIDPALVDPQHPSLVWGYPTAGSCASELRHLTTNTAPTSLGHRRLASSRTMSHSTGSPSGPSRAFSNEPFNGSRSIQRSQYVPFKQLQIFPLSLILSPSFRVEARNELRCQWPECAEGAKEFSSKHCLKRHVETIHERPGAYACEICGRRFNRPDNLREHERRGHPDMK